MEQSPYFSIIIPTCNRPEDLAKCLACLEPARQDYPVESYEVIVTDDGRAVCAEEQLKLRFPWVCFITGPGRGPAANRNHGASQARHPWLIFVDDDCLPSSGYLQAYADAIQTHPQESIFEGRTSAVGIRRRFDEEAPINEQGGCLWSCNVCLRSSFFVEIERFDEAFPGAAMEDVEFRVRSLKAGEKLVFVPQAQVLHPWRRRKGAKFALVYANSVKYFLSKHPANFGSFTPWSLLRNLVKCSARKLILHGREYKWRGLLRELMLDGFSTCCVFFSLHVSKKTILLHA